MFETSGVSFSVHSSLWTCIGPWTVLPYSSSNGENPIDACGTSLYANRTADKYLSQSLGFSRHSFFYTFLKNPFILSQSPLHFGLYGIVNNCLSDISLQTSFMRFEVNWLPSSLKISVKKPTLKNTSSKASANLSVSILGNPTASGYFIAKSTIVKLYLLPLSDTCVMGPFRSTATQWNCTSIIGIFQRGTFVLFSSGTVFWHISHNRNNLVTSLVIPGQWKLVVIWSIVFFAAKCPPTIDSWARLITRFLCSDGTTTCFMMFKVSPLTCSNILYRTPFCFTYLYLLPHFVFISLVSWTYDHTYFNDGSSLCSLYRLSMSKVSNCELGTLRVRKMSKIRKQCNQVPHLTKNRTWESNNKHHQQEPRGQPFPSRWPQCNNEQTQKHEKHKAQKTNDPQKKYHIGTVSKNIMKG